MKTELYKHGDVFRLEKANDALVSLSQWLRDYAMSDNADLGRSGTVCPFAKQASKLDTLLVGINLAGPDDEDHVFTEIRTSFRDLERIPAPPGKENLRTIAVGFPNCTSPAGIAMLNRIYKRHKYYTLLRNRMVAFFHPDADVHGLWNESFRPMRSPMPMLAVRYVVEQDAAFAAKHRLMRAPYLLRFGLAGARRLADYRQRKAISQGKTG